MTLSNKVNQENVVFVYLNTKHKPVMRHIGFFTLESPVNNLMRNPMGNHVYNCNVVNEDHNCFAKGPLWWTHCFIIDHSLFTNEYRTFISSEEDLRYLPNFTFTQEIDISDVAGWLKTNTGKFPKC